jgi:hypothetical protein
VAFDFPASPTVGAIYSPPGGPSWQWDGAKWIQVTGSTSPPVPLTAEARNRIVNGAMQISQETGNTLGSVTGYFAADQWSINISGAAVLSSQRVQVPTPNGSANRLRWIVTTADTSITGVDLAYVTTMIEGTRIADFRWGSAAARQVVLRFGFKGPAGTYSVNFNGGGGRSYITTFTITAGQAGTDTEQVFVVPGDVAGTWAVDSSRALELKIGLACGPTVTGVLGWQASNALGAPAQTNGVGAVNNTFELFDVGLYLDRNNTGLAPPWQMPDEAAELAACQRYYEKATSWFNSNVTNAAAYYAMAWIKVPKRTAASLSGVNISNVAFPATVGTLSIGADYAQEGRTANVTGNTGVFASTVTFNARM